jgi:hypothetical protein
MAAYHDADQGSSPQAVNNKKLIFVCHEMDDTQESSSCAAWTFTLHFSFQHQLTDQPPGMRNIPDFVRYISGMYIQVQVSD